MECKWFKNLVGFAGSRPPFVIFTLCLALFAAGLFSIGYYVQSQDFDPNQSSQWKAFTSRLSNKKFCMFGNASHFRNISNSSAPTPPDLVQVYVPIVVRFSPSNLYFGDIQNVSHVTTLVRGSELGLKDSLSSHQVNLTLQLFRQWSMSCSYTKCSPSAFSACISTTLPAGIVPNNLPRGACNTSQVVNMVSMTSFGQCSSSDCCNEGVVAKASLPKYYHDHPVEGPSEIGLNDWATVNLRLQYSSYLLFVLAITCILYGMIKGRTIKSSSKKGSPGQTI